MRIIAIICIPVIMLADYYLTLLGKKFRDSKYSEHLSSPEYELNPAWQKDVNSFKLFNYKHILSIILITGYFYFASKLLSDDWFFGLYGALFTVYGYVIMRHFQNIFIYRYSNKNPDLLSGKVTMGHVLMLKISQYQLFTTSVFLLVLSAWSASWFICGGGLGILLLALTKYRWIAAYKKKMQAVKQN